MLQSPLNDQALIARQPILDTTGNLFGYELLFRSHKAINNASITDATQATARVIVNALNSIGVENLVGKSKAFINCDRRMIIENVFAPLDPKVFVLEVLEDIVADEEMVKLITSLSVQGFEIALDDFILSDQHISKVEALYPLINYVKVDLPSNSREQLAAIKKHFSKYPRIQLLAEKVESNEDFVLCQSFGFTLFQGYFFARPEMLKGRRVDPRTNGLMQLLQLLRTDPEMDEIENQFKQQPELTISMLKFINSAAIGTRNRIDSIRQAINLVGHRKLQQWLTLMMFAGNAESSQSQVLYTNASQRAKFLELLVKNTSHLKSISEQAFLIGMLSYMDALCRIPLPKILAEFDLGDDINAALLQHEGILGELLFITESIQADRTHEAIQMCNALNISTAHLHDALTDSWAWAHSLAL